MSWFKVDDKFHGHPKAVEAAAQLAALGLWVLAGSYCSDYPETDGFVSLQVATRLAGGTNAAKRLGAVLVAAKGSSRVGLWVVAEGGWRFHDWGQYQPTAEDVAERLATLSAKRAEAGRKGAVARWQLPMANDGKRDGKTMAIAISENGKRMAPIPIPIPNLPPPPSGATPTGVAIDDENQDWGLAAAAPEPAKASRRKPETDCPASGEDPIPWLTQWAIPLPSADPEVLRFLDHHRAKGNRMRDWGAAWRKWKAGAFLPPSATRLRVVQQAAGGPDSESFWERKAREQERDHG